MVRQPVYLDNHATTRVDPRVIESLVVMLDRDYGNAGSTSHRWGRTAREAVETARASLAAAVGASPREIVFTSGATESNNLALRGLADSPRRRGRHVVSVATEHKAILDPLARLARRDVEVTWLTPRPQGDLAAGQVDPDQVAQAIRDDTFLVTVMLANNEIGVIQPLAEIGAVCRQRGVTLHSDATQAVGKIPVDVGALQVDLMSFSAHKMYGPKGVGALYVRSGTPRIRLAPLIDGGGQERGLRSGTLNVPGIVGMAQALELCLAEQPVETPRLGGLRDRLALELMTRLDGVQLNGPGLHDRSLRLAANLNLSFSDVDGEALMMNLPDVAVSSGSACTSANPEPSHVLCALGLSPDRVRSSLRFGLGRFNTDEDIAWAIESLIKAVDRLRQMSPRA